MKIKIMKIKDIILHTNGKFVQPIKKRTFRFNGWSNFFKLNKAEYPLKWTDKHGTPVLRKTPCVEYNVGLLFIRIDYIAPLSNVCKSSHYWEQIIWFIFYADKDIKKASKTYPWTNKHGITRWNNKITLSNEW